MQNNVFKITVLFLIVFFVNQFQSLSQKHPNVILFVFDDASRIDFGCYGNKNVKTPGTDALAKEGTSYNKAFCTTSSCSPSRSVILSGLHNHRNGMYGLNHDYHNFQSHKDFKSLPVILDSLGYATARMGKFHVGPEEVYKFRYILPEPPGTRVKDQSTPQKYIWQHDVVQWANICKPFIDTVSSPFFLYFCVHHPHHPFETIGADSVPIDKVTKPGYSPNLRHYQKEYADFLRAIQNGDKAIVQLIHILKKSGKWDNTVFMVTSDNGAPFPNAKTNLYEPGINLPFVIRDPLVKAKNIKTDAMISFTDIAPTILDYAGYRDNGKRFHGKSFKSTVGKTVYQGFDEVYGSHTFHEITNYYPMRMIRTEKYKLIWNIASALPYPSGAGNGREDNPELYDYVHNLSNPYGKKTVKDYVYRPVFELYDIQQDPDEIVNLAFDKKYTSVLEELKLKIRIFQKQTNDPWIIKWREFDYH